MNKLPGDQFDADAWLQAKKDGVKPINKVMPASLREAIEEVIRLAKAVEIPVVIGLDLGESQEAFYDLGPHAQNVSTEFLMARNAIATFSDPSAAHYTQNILFNGGMQFLKRLPR